AELRELAKREAGVHVPTTQMRTVRELEPPSTDEGLAGVDQVAFVRAPRPGRAGVFVAAAALREPTWRNAFDEADRTTPHLVFDWIPDGAVDALAEVVTLLAAEVAGPVESAVCPHGGGPPRGGGARGGVQRPSCRGAGAPPVACPPPPLPGLPLAFAHAHGVDPARSTL